MKKFFILFVGIALFSSARGFAPLVLDSGEKQVSLLELYTSEGCSSCPPAEAWLSTLKNNPDLWKKFVPVSFHVDYWNDLGWPDPYSTPDYTQRQRIYGAEWQSQSIYTPEFVLNGREAHPMDESVAVSGNTTGDLKATLQSDGKIFISFTPHSSVTKSPILGTLVAEAALLGNNVQSVIPRGENSGHTLRHDFIVLSLTKCLLELSSSGEYKGTLTLPSQNKAPVAALALWARTVETLTPIQAVGGWLKSR